MGKMNRINTIKMKLISEIWRMQPLAEGPPLSALLAFSLPPWPIKGITSGFLQGWDVAVQVFEVASRTCSVSKPLLTASIFSLVYPKFCF